MDDRGVPGSPSDALLPTRRTVSLRIPFDSLTLCAVADELRRTVVGAVVQQAGQPDPLDLALTLHVRGRNHALLLSCHAVFARVLLTSARRRNPAEPPAFCMVARKHLLGARLVEVRQRGFDRVLDFVFEDGDGRRVRLVAELMGKHANLVLVGEDGLVLDAAKRIGPRLNRVRTTLPGHRYVDPPAQPGRVNPLRCSPEDRAAAWAQMPEDTEAASARLMARFEGLSPFLASELILRARAASPEVAWEELLGAAQRGEWRPVLIRNERGETVGAYPFETLQASVERQSPRASLLSALDAYYLAAIPRAERDAARHEFAGQLRKALAARERRIAELQRLLAEADRARTLRQHADLLMAHAHEAPANASEVVLPDDYNPGGESIVLPLDPALSAYENAQALYRRCRKLQDGAVHAAGELARAEDEAAELRAALERLDDLPDAASVRAARGAMVEAGLLRAGAGAPATPGAARAAEADFEGHRIRRIATPEGFEILVGESATANDYLTRRVAEPDDLWFHVRANTGAHVVVRTRRKPSAVPPRVIREAARLAAAHSSARHSSIVPVDYTLKKYVRRPKGGALGQALYSNEKTIHIEPQ